MRSADRIVEIDLGGECGCFGERIADLIENL